MSLLTGTKNIRSKIIPDPNVFGVVTQLVNLLSGSVPLPNSWSNFMALAQNKEDLAELLSEQLLLHVPVGKTIVVSGGFKESTTVKYSNKALGMTLLQATHEEADTRIVLHCVHTITLMWCLLETQMCLFC